MSKVSKSAECLWAENSGRPRQADHKMGNLPEKLSEILPQNTKTKYIHKYMHAYIQQGSGFTPKCRLFTILIIHLLTGKVFSNLLFGFISLAFLLFLSYCRIGRRRRWKRRRSKRGKGKGRGRRKKRKKKEERRWAAANGYYPVCIYCVELC